MAYAVTFRTDEADLAKLLPPGFRLREPELTVAATYLSEIEWLAGRGYNTLGVTCPVTYESNDAELSGSFLFVLWENLADPIITGRDDLGYPKLWCELPEPRVLGSEVTCTASWLGFEFMVMQVSDPRPISAEEYRREVGTRLGTGTFVHKYVPRTGAWGEADVSYITMTPVGDLVGLEAELYTANGTVAFDKGTWEQLPTLTHIVAALQDLQVLDYVGATITRGRGGTDYRNQQALGEVPP